MTFSGSTAIDLPDFERDRILRLIKLCFRDESIFLCRNICLVNAEQLRERLRPLPLYTQ
jgi:hypothetical protein